MHEPAPRRIRKPEMPQFFQMLTDLVSPLASVSGQSANEVPMSVGFTQPPTLARMRELQKNMKEVTKRYRARMAANGSANNGPPPSPYLVDIVDELSQYIEYMWQVNPENLLEEELFARVLLASVEFKVQRLLKILKNSNLEENRKEKKEVTTLTLILSHTLQDVRHVYKDYTLFTNFRITKSQAAEFWTGTFGHRVIVPWGEFLTHLKQHSEVVDAKELKATMDITENDHISWLEFDVFTRLFQPWERLLANWATIVLNHPGYKAFMTYEEVQQLLSKHTHQPGTYVFRLSCTRLGQWAIGYVTIDGRIVQTIPQNRSLYQALIEGAKSGIYTHPDGREKNIDMSDHIVSVPQQHIQATKEQFELYQEIDTTFEMCKICSERSKDMRIEPCGHLICTHCLREWQKQRKSVCPFCRHEIRDTSRVKVLGYLDKENREITSSAPPSPRYIPRTSQSSIASPTASRSYPREGSAHATDLLTAPLTGRRHASSPSPIPPPSPDTASSRSLSVAPSRPPPEPGMYVRSRSEASLPSLPQNGDIPEPIYANVLTTAAATPPRQPRHQTTPNQPFALAPPPPLRAPSSGSLPLYSSPLAQASSTPSSSSANHNGVGSINSTPHVPARRRPSSTGSMGASTQNVPGMVVNAPSRPLSTVPSEADSAMPRLPVIISTQSSGTLTHMHTHPPPAPRRSLQSDFSGTMSLGSDRETQSNPQRPLPGLDNTQSLPDMSSPAIPPRPSHSPSPLAGQLVRGAGSNAELNTAAASAPAS